MVLTTLPIQDNLCEGRGMPMDSLACKFCGSELQMRSFVLDGLAMLVVACPRLVLIQHPAEHYVFLPTPLTDFKYDGEPNEGLSRGAREA